MAETIQPRVITDEVRESYLDYAMSVIVARALPDVRDGLKPVQRRILYAMRDMGLRASGRFRKSAAVVGEVLGRYHPHGDLSVYEAMARLTQDFSLRHPLVDGQGNWGSTEDAPAAMRYCVTGDTLVVTDRGLVPIRTIAEAPEEADIHLRVLSRDGAIHAASKWFDSGEHPTVRIQTHHGFALRGTANHPVLVWERSVQTGELRFVWKLLSEIRPGDVTVIERSADLLWPTECLELSPYWPDHGNRRTVRKHLPTHLTEDLAFILGALLAEGTIHETEIEFCNSDAVWMSEFLGRWQRVFPDCRLHHFHRSPSSYGKKPYETFEVHSRYVVDFLRNIGLPAARSADKRVPSTILQSPQSVVAAFLRAYFEGDGGISWSGKMTELSCVSVSDDLLRELQVLLLRFGIAATRRYDRYRRTVKLYLRGLMNLRRFRDAIGFVSTRKRERLEGAIGRLSRDGSATEGIPYLSAFVRTSMAGPFPLREFLVKHNFDRYENLSRHASRVAAALRPAARVALAPVVKELLATRYVFDRVVSVESAGTARVYSLRVDSACHSFVANGFINHNTEARLSRLGEAMLADIERDTVSFADNYDRTKTEPTVLPSALPNLLVNGTVGIAVGMATNIPPHNLREVIDALVRLAGDPHATVEDLLEYIHGPDFPTGGIVYGAKDIAAAYATGKGPMVTRAKTEIVEEKNGDFRILVTEIPFQVNKASLLEEIADGVRTKRLEGIRDLRDESDKDGTRIVIELKRDAVPNKVLNQLFNHTALQRTFHVNLLALVNGIEPRVLTLKGMLEQFLEHRRVVVRRRSEYDLKRAKERAHILEGLTKALDHIDAVITTIKKSETKEEAHGNLKKKFDLSDAQATAILEMRLQTLAGLEQKAIQNELQEKRRIIRELTELLGSPKKITGVVIDDLLDLHKRFGEDRKTTVSAQPVGEFRVEDLIPDEDTVVTVTTGGYVKRLPVTAYRVQRRGGRGVIGMTTKEEDTVDSLFVTRTHADILFFTNLGRVFAAKAYDLPLASRTAKGQALPNFLSLGSGEKVTAVLALPKGTFTKQGAVGKRQKGTAGPGYLVMVTRQGTVKRVPLTEFANVRRSGLMAIRLHKGDTLDWVARSSDTDHVMLVTARGQSIRFKEGDVRAMGRPAAGVHAMRLKRGDEVIGMALIPYGGKANQAPLEGHRPLTGQVHVLILTEHGFGKRTLLSAYKVQRRAGSGIKTAQVTGKTGPVVGMALTPIAVGDDATIIVTSAKGQAIRVPVNSIRVLGRATQGVRVMRMEEKDAVASFTTFAGGI